MELSKRLEHVAGLVTKGAFAADIGTDHAYVPVYLLQQGISEKALAMDINKGPLERAALHIRSYGYADRIETRLSNGMEAMHAGEVDTVILAGMGGPLMSRILTAYPEKTESVREFILQPQSEIREFRKFLIENGFQIIVEDMVLEDGKYYPMMKAVHGISEEYRDIELKYGKMLLESGHPVLKDYIEKELRHTMKLIRNLDSHHSEKTIARIHELEEEMKLIMKAREEMNDEM